MKIYLCLCVVLVFTANDVYSQKSECRTPDGGVGICNISKNLPIISNNYRKVIFNMVNETEKIRISQDINQRHAVCMDNDKNKFCEGQCKTPEGISGVVKNLTDCPHLKKSPNQHRYRIGKTSKYCCSPAPKPLAVAQCNSAIDMPPDPASTCCGRDASIDSRIVGGSEAGIDAFPWAVVLENKKKLSCGGSLISNRHVITAAHCTYLNGGPMITARVGEYDKANPGRDCIELPDGALDCTDGAVKVPIEAYLVHPDHDSNRAVNDIAIVWLRDSVPYTDFVRPICLPSADYSKNVNIQFQVTGWGAGSRNPSLKQVISLGLFDYQECQENYKEYYGPNWHRVPYDEGRLCAGGEANKDSCTGDSGSPLMAQSDGRYWLAGVVSYGPELCGKRGVPGVYVNVYHYLQWIRDSLNVPAGRALV